MNLEEATKDLSIYGKLIHQVFEFTRVFISEEEAKELIALISKASMEANKWEDTVMKDMQIRETLKPIYVDKAPTRFTNGKTTWAFQLADAVARAQAELTWHSRDKEVKEARKEILTRLCSEIEKEQLSEGEIGLAIVESRRDPVRTYARYRAIAQKMKQHILNKLKEGVVIPKQD